MKDLVLACVASVAVFGIMGDFNQQGGGSVGSSKPWMAAASPTELEWFALRLQADEGDGDFGENGLEIHFYLGPRSLETGTIYCQVYYLPTIRADVLLLKVQGIRDRFEVRKQAQPWAKLEIEKTAARL